MGKTNERRTSMSGEEAGGLKTCPRCGAKLFADMDVCYGCLYDFATEHERPVDVGDGGVMSELLQALDEPDLAEGPTPGSVPPESGRALEAVGTAPTGGEPALREKDELLEPVARLVPPTHVRLVMGRVSMCMRVPEGGLSIGRDPGSDVVVTCASVSPRHLEVRMEQGAMVARDLGASNPALLNGWALAGPCSLRMGDRLDVRGAGLSICPVCAGERGGEEP